MVNKTETEIRGKLSKKESKILFETLKSEGKLLKNYKRLTADISPGFDPKTRTWKNTDALDLRIKKSGDKEKISLKVGNFDSLKRKEIEVSLKSGEFIDTLALFESLGFNQGMVYYWENWEYRLNDFEVKISKFNDNYFIWEIENEVDGANPYSLAEKLRLKPFTKQEFREAIDYQNLNINKLYSLDLVKKLL